MENKNNITIEELVKVTRALKEATAELAAATEHLVITPAGSAEPVKTLEEAAQVLEQQAAEKMEASLEPAEQKAEAVTEQEAEVSKEAEAKTAEEETSEEEPDGEVSKETEEEAGQEKTEVEKDVTSEDTIAEKTPKKTSKASNVIFTLLRIVLVVALVAAIVFYVFLRNKESNVPAADVFNAVTQSVDTDKMEQTTDRYFKKYYGLNAADYDDVLYYAPVSNMDAEELLVVKLKDVSQAEAVTDAILKRQADKEQSFEGYAPEQYALAQAYILDVQGNYILFVVDPKAEEIDAAFAGAL